MIREFSDKKPVMWMNCIKNIVNPIPHVSGPEVPSLTLHPYTGRMGLGVCSIN